MITYDDFESVYWSQYVSIEREFNATIPFVTLGEENDSTYSVAYLKLLLQIGSEIDILLKLYCCLIDPQFRGSKIREYIECLRKEKPGFFDQKIVLMQMDSMLIPWSLDKDDNPPFWWKVYNKSKHDRMTVGVIEGEKKEYYKFANQKAIISALAGLYQIELYYFYEISESRSIRIPLPGSRLFQLTGGIWNEVTFWGDVAFQVDVSTGNLMMYTNSKLHF